jgi:hypothetical protein
LKTYVLPRKLLSQIDEVLARRPDSRHSPLQAVVDLLHYGRNYFFTGAYLRAEDLSEEQSYTLPEKPHPAETKAKELEATAELIVPIKIGVHVLGMLKVQSMRALGGADRVLIEATAKRLARFLSWDGRYLMRHLRESSRARNTPNAHSAKA